MSDEKPEEVKLTKDELALKDLEESVLQGIKKLKDDYSLELAKLTLPDEVHKRALTLTERIDFMYEALKFTQVLVSFPHGFITAASYNPVVPEGTALFVLNPKDKE